MADARVYTTLKKIEKSESGGVADSRVAQGLVALLSHGLCEMTPPEVLASSGDELTKRCKLDDVLSRENEWPAKYAHYCSETDRKWVRCSLVHA